jgi:protein transport protein YIF1
LLTFILFTRPFNLSLFVTSPVKRVFLLFPLSSLMANYYNSQSPPPLQHPVPTHPAFIPEPPSTPASPQSYQRYASSPSAPQNSHHFSHGNSSYPQFPHQPPSHLAHLQNQPPLSHSIPDFSAWGIDGPTAQFGMQLGQNAVAAGQSYVQRNVGLFSLHKVLIIPPF